MTTNPETVYRFSLQLGLISGVSCNFFRGVFLGTENRRNRRYLAKALSPNNRAKSGHTVAPDSIRSQEDFEKPGSLLSQGGRKGTFVQQLGLRFVKVILRRALTPGMVLGMNLLQALFGDMGVNLGRRDIRVPEHELNPSQVRVVLHQMGGEGMTQSVR
jgi:hypothetical protein